MRHRERRAARRRLAAPLSGSLAALFAVSYGCSVATNEEPRAGSCTPFQLVSLTPPGGATPIRTDSTFVYAFTDFPDPDSAVNANFGVFSGPYYYTARESADLIGRAILFKPTSSLPSGLGFTLTMSAQIQSLRGCPLTPAPPALPNGKPAPSYYFPIQTAEPGSDLPAPPAPPPPATFAQVLDVAARHCAGGGCHLDPAGRADAGGCLAAPGGGLSLCPAQAYDAMVSVGSRQVNRLTIVVPRDSARSYLLRKLLDAPPVAGHQGPPDDALTEDDLRVFQSWIDNGAPGPAPPPDGGA